MSLVNGTRWGKRWKGSPLILSALIATVLSFSASASMVSASETGPLTPNAAAEPTIVTHSGDDVIPAGDVRFLGRGEPLRPTVTPVLRRNTLYLALPDLVRALEASFRWDGSGMTAVITSEGAKLELHPNTGQGRLNGEEYRLNGLPFQQDETLFVPLRSVAEALGFQVGWDPLNRVAFVLPRTPRIEGSESQPPISLPGKNYGPFDAKGIPTKDYRGQLGVQYNPLVVIEYAQSYYGLYLSTHDTRYRRAFFRMTEWLVSNLEPLAHHEAEGVLVWYYKYDWPPYNNAPWISAITQGQGVDVLLNAFLLSGDPVYLEKAKAAFSAFKVPDNVGGVLSTDTQGRIFLEEAPTEPPSRILNGFLSNLLTVYRYQYMLGDEAASQLFQAGTRSVMDLLPMYDVPDQQRSRYDLYDRVLFHLVTDKGGASESHPVSAIVVQPPTDSEYRIEVGTPQAAAAPGNRLLVSPSTAWSSARMEDGRMVRDFGPVEATYRHAAFYLMLSGNLLGGNSYSLSVEYRDVSREPVYLEIYSPVVKHYIRLGTFAGEGDGEWKWLHVQFSPATIGETGIGHLASPSYHHMHVGYLELLYQLTGERQVSEYAQRWRAYEKNQ